MADSILTNTENIDTLASEVRELRSRWRRSSTTERAIGSLSHSKHHLSSQIQIQLTTEKSNPAVLTPPMNGMLPPPGEPVGPVRGALEELEERIELGLEEGGGALDTLLAGRH